MIDTNTHLEDLLLQDYVTEQSISPHVSEGGGFFALGEALSLLAILILAAVVLYVIGGIRNKKKHGKWLKLDGDYFKGIGQGFTIWAGTFMGNPVPKAFVDSSDGAYADLSRLVVDDIVECAYAHLSGRGITYKTSYKWRVFDCEDFAMAMKSECAGYYAEQYQHPNRGAPFALFGYTKKNGQKHVCLKAVADGKAVFYEVYPDYAGELKLTAKEIKSRDLELF